MTLSNISPTLLTMRLRTALLTMLTLTLSTLLTTSCIGDDAEPAAEADIVRVNDPIPDFELQGADGSRLSSTALRGHVVLLNFFDTTCPDCRQELPVIQQVYNRYGDAVTVLNVPRSQTAGEVEKYWQQANLTVPYYTPTEPGLYYRFASSSIPRLYIIDAKGTVRATFDDSPLPTLDAIDDVLRPLFAEDTARQPATTNVTFRVRVPKQANDNYYFHNEYTISHLDAYFFDTDTKQIATMASVGGLTEADNVFDTEYDIIYLFRNMRIKVGKFDIFLVANYPHLLKDITNEQQLLDLVDGETYANGIAASLPLDGPVMTSRATALYAVNLLPYVNRDYVVNIEVERVMAKLQIGVAQNSFPLTHDGKTYAVVNITNYKLVNLNTSYYLFQHRDELTALPEQPQFKFPLNYSDYSEQGNQYVVDPLFYQKQPTMAALTAYGKQCASWYGNFNASDFAAMPAAGNYGLAYILENTVYRTSQFNGYTPGIVFKASVSPSFVYLYNRAEHDLKEENRPEYWPQTIYLYKYNFYGSIQAINFVDDLQLDELQDYTDAELSKYGIKQCRFNMGSYETHYTYWIQHRPADDQPMGPMRYGVVRNHFYRMVISKITGIGYSQVSPEVMREDYPNSFADIVVDKN